MFYNKVLVTTDFSDDSYSAFEVAAYQAKMEGSELYLLSVIGDWEVPVAMYRSVPNREIIDGYRADLIKSAEEKLEKLVEEHFHGQEVKTKVVSTNSAVGQAVADYAADIKADLIVMSSHGRGALANFFVGSVVQKVVSLIKKPILIVPRKQEK